MCPLEADEINGVQPFFCGEQQQQQQPPPPQHVG